LLDFKICSIVGLYVNFTTYREPVLSHLAAETDRRFVLVTNVKVTLSFICFLGTILRQNRCSLRCCPGGLGSTAGLAGAGGGGGGGAGMWCVLLLEDDLTGFSSSVLSSEEEVDGSKVKH